MFRGLTISLVLLSTVVLSACAGKADVTAEQKNAAPTIRLKKTLLRDVRAMSMPDTVTISPDLRHIAFIEHHGGTFAVVRDQEMGKEYKKVYEYSLTFSPDSKRMAYVASEGDGKYFAVLDGVEGKTYQYVRDVVFSADSKKMVFVALLADRWTVVANGVEGKRYEGIYGPPYLSADGAHVAYHAESAGKQFVVVDGREAQRYDDVSHLSFSPDGNKVAYVAQDGNKWLIVYDGITSDARGEFWQMTLSSDGKHLAWRVETNGKQRMVIDRVDGPEYDCVMGAIYSPDSKRLAYVVRHGDATFDGESPYSDGVLVDGVEGKQYDHGSIGILVFSPDSQHIACVVGTDQKKFVVKDGEDGKQYDDVMGLVFSADSKHMAYFAESDGKCFVVVDGVEKKRYEDIGLGSLVFGPDSAHYTYVAKAGQKWKIVVDENEVGEYDDYITNCYKEVRLATLYRDFLAFDSPTLLHTLMLRDGRVYIAEVNIGE